MLVEPVTGPTGEELPDPPYAGAFGAEEDDATTLLLDPPYTGAVGAEEDDVVTLFEDSETALTGEELLPLAWTVTVVW